jgi:hypothetical protein
VLDERGANGRAGAGDDVQRALRDAGLGGQRRIAQDGERRERRRLEHDRVPGRQRRGDLPVGDVEREVPRRDEPDDADRLPEGERDAVALDRDRVAEELVDGARVVADHVDDHAKLAAGVRDGHADVPALQQGELLGMLLDERRKAVHAPPARHRRERAPAVVRPHRRRHCPVHVLAAALRDRGERRGAGGIHDLERSALGRGNPLAADEEPLHGSHAHAAALR